MTSKSLNEYATELPKNNPGPPAWIDSIDEWPEVLEAWQAGISGTTIRRWLIEEKGYSPREATQNRVERRLRDWYPR